MALFTSLYQVGEVIAHLLRKRLPMTDTEVVVGPPRDAIGDPKRHLRLTLLWVNEQPTHRNDPPERNADGTRILPPLSLTAFYLLTSYGNTSQEESVEAHETLGEAMCALHDEPELSLPLTSLPLKGQGTLGIQLVPLTPELLEKLFGPLQIKHRPFALYEVGPAQLRSQKKALAARPVVAPGGARLTGPTVRERPTLQRIVPSTQGAGGRVRLDGVFPGAAAGVRVGTTVFEGPTLQVIDGGRSVRIALPTSFPEGVHAVSITAGGLASEPLELRVVAGTEARLDGPSVIERSKGQPLVLSGSGLAQTVEVVAWPDDGVQSPADVVPLPLASPATNGQLTIAPASLGALSERAYRFAARLGAGAYQFTPYVVLKVTP